MVNDTIGSSVLQTPCFIFHEAEFDRNLQNFHGVLSKYFNNAVIGYSFKTNSLPRLLELVLRNGCFAEVVSDDEYMLACKIGFSKQHIIFNGPVKGYGIFTNAIMAGSLVNIDSHREIEWLQQLNGNLDQTIDIGIRVNIDLESALPGQSSTGNEGGRFGFCSTNEELHKTIETIQMMDHIRLNRLHMHVSNASKSTEVYQYLAKEACDIIQKENLSISCIDFGGGYFGGGDNGETYEKYVSVIYGVLRENGLEKIDIIVEPGASVCATAFSYLTTVVDTKETNYGSFAVTDGTRLHIDPFMRREKYIYNCTPERENSLKETVICGYTCMEKDRIMKINKRIEQGDRIKYKITGSYSMCFNSLFISYLPSVYSEIEPGKYTLVREKWGIEEYLQKNRWEI